MAAICYSTEVPVMWVRVDPEMQWIRRMNMQQPDTVWQNIIKYERDAVAQLEVKFTGQRRSMGWWGEVRNMNS